MVFEDSFFEDEIREGFYVPAIMKRAWAAQLEVLEAIDKICKKHNIQYFAQWGTLLGAVRHHGFIPWDDDLDIGMKRPDYDKFVRVAPQEFSGEYNYLNFSQDEEFGDFLTRVLNTRRIHLDDEFLEEFHQFPYVAGVDIFPWDYINPDKEKDKEQRLLIQIVNSTAEALLNGAELSEAKENLCEIEKLCNVKFNRKKKIVCQLKMLAEQLCGMNTYKETNEITLMPLYVNGTYQSFPKSYFENFIMIPFENISIPVPMEYDEILKRNYGQYMIPVRGWDSHNYPFFEGMEENIEKVCEVIPYEYKLPENDRLVQLREERYNKESTIYQQVLNMVDLMMKAEKEVMSYIKLNQLNECCQILVQCQSAAIRIGSLLEQQYADNSDCRILTTVKELERYCENIYQLHQVLSDAQESEIGAIEAHALQYVKTIQQSLLDIQDDIKSISDCEHKSKIVFLVYRAKYWNVYNELWKEKCADHNNEVKVIPIPYYNKTFKRKMLEQHCDNVGYPQNVEVIDWQQYDFAKERPDEIYIQNPYDEYDCAYSVHPFFYASNLRKYTDQLIFVPALRPDDFDMKDERMVKMIKYYVCTPGVVLADRVFVQSEKIRKNYIDILNEATDTSMMEMWEKVIEVHHLDEKKHIYSELPVSWQEKIYRKDGKRKKVILYNIGLSQLLHGNQKMIEKIEKTLIKFKKYKDDVILLWYNDKAELLELRKNNNKVWNDYQKIVEKYDADDWGICDCSGDEKRAYCLSDAFYGDNGRMMNLFCAGKKPIMCQNPEVE